MRLFVISAPGLENLTAHEMEAVGWFDFHGKSHGLRMEAGGISFEGSLIDVYRSNLFLRTASRVMVRLGSFFAVGFAELRRKAAHLPWEDFLSKDQPFTIRVSTHQSRLYHQKGVSERIAGAISDRLDPLSTSSSPGGDGTPRQLILVRLVQDQCTISIDSSGELLHRRGYRLETAKAPLRETLAAAMLLASGWDRSSPLLDPFCGSGTIPVEAALMARNIPPGLRRPFAFMNWPTFKNKTWGMILSQNPSGEQTTIPTIFGSDRDAGAVRTAKANAERAGVSDDIRFSCQSVSAMDPFQAKGWVVANPPYGVRTGSNKDLRNLYAQLGKVLKGMCPGWNVTLLCNDIRLIQSTGLKFDEGVSLVNGGIRVKMFHGVV